MNEIETITDIKDLKNIEWNEGLKSAYALNLCTVSISQILNSKDQYIMDQEYNAILNNLNLENMPDNESLLDVLKEILDVITFFKIQEGDKAIAEEEYKQEVKNALMNAVNITAIMGSLTSLSSINPNPVSWIKTGATIVAEVGVGYMNYRNGKKSADFNKKRRSWELQKAAIEELNSLKRQLFNTAWKMTKEEKFVDEYRLTEVQIDQYNDILLDEDVYSRYERLDFIKDKFLAYPPFWYHLGHAANLISQLESGKFAEKYRDCAIECFEYLIHSARTNLLRDDQIVASCSLEYAEILNDSAVIEKNIDNALKFSGNANDILQLCAIGYLKIQEPNTIKKAARLFQRLINEHFNADINGQILSMIYVNEYRKATESSQKELIRYNHSFLVQRIPHPEYILELPENNVVENETTYYKRQVTAIKSRWLKAISKYSQLYKIKSYELIVINPPQIPTSKRYNNDYVYEAYSKTLTQEGKDGNWSYYQSLLAERKLRYRIIDFINEYIGGLLQFIDIQDSELEHIHALLASEFSQENSWLKQIEDEVENGNFNFESAINFLNRLKSDKKLQFIEEVGNSFSICFGERFKDIDNNLTDDEKKEDAISTMQNFEIELYQFCSKYNIALEESSIERDIQSSKLIDVDIFGEEDGEQLRRDNEKYEKHQQKINGIVAEIRRAKDDILFPNHSPNVNLIIRGDKEFEPLIRDYGLSRYKQRICAIIDDAPKNQFVKRLKRSESLAFLTDGLLVIDNKDFTSYDELGYDPRHKYVIINDAKYKCSAVNFDKLEELTQILMVYDYETADEHMNYISIEEMVEKAKKIVKNYTAAASGTGAIPLPFADMIPLVGEQVAMMFAIAKVFGIHFEKDGLTAIANGVITTAGASLIGRNAVKAILNVLPGGVFVSGIISASTAGTLTYGVGMAFIELCKKIRSGEISADDRNETLNFMNNTVNSNSETYKSEYAAKVEENNLIIAENDARIKEKETDLYVTREDTLKGIIERNKESNELVKDVLSDVVDRNNSWAERIETAKEESNKLNE